MEIAWINNGSHELPEVIAANRGGRELALMAIVRRETGGWGRPMFMMLAWLF